MCSVGGVRGKWPSEQAFAEINSIVDWLSQEDVTAVPAEAMADDQIALQRIGSRVQAEAMRRLRRFDRGQGYANTLALSAKAWMRWKCNLDPDAASRQVDIARQLESLPQTSKAFADGDISFTHVSLIAKTAKRLGDRMEAEAEGVLVKLAAEVDPRRLRRAATMPRHCLEPDEVLKDANEQREPDSFI